MHIIKLFAVCLVLVAVAVYAQPTNTVSVTSTNTTFSTTQSTNVVVAVSSNVVLKLRK